MTDEIGAQQTNEQPSEVDQEATRNTIFLAATSMLIQSAAASQDQRLVELADIAIRHVQQDGSLLRLLITNHLPKAPEQTQPEVSRNQASDKMRQQFQQTLEGQNKERRQRRQLHDDLIRTLIERIANG